MPPFKDESHHEKLMPCKGRHFAKIVREVFDPCDFLFIFKPSEAIVLENPLISSIGVQPVLNTMPLNAWLANIFEKLKWSNSVCDIS